MKVIECSVQAKQKNGESERAVLCKVWEGNGDYSTLSGGARGFEKKHLPIDVYFDPTTTAFVRVDEHVGSRWFLG